MAVDALISIGGKFVELLVEPIGTRSMYIIHQKISIRTLRSQVEILEALRKDLQDDIDEAKRNGRVLRAEVTLWVDKVDKSIEEAKTFLQVGSTRNNKCLKGLIPNLATRYQQGKEAAERTQEVEKLLREGKFTNISNPAPPVGIEYMPSGSVETTYEATKLAMEKVMGALRDENINFIGIHGIAGVGKTTLVKKIAKIVKEDKLFDEVAMVVVSQNQNIRNIQSDLAGWMGCNLSSDEPTTLRATKLCARMKSVRRILVILDDVWADLDLADVGIPLGDDHQGCKIILTTRREQVCRSMGTTMRVRVDVLSEHDSWQLFRMKAGTNIVDSPTVTVAAREVWKECGNLPLALVTVGGAMRGKDDPEEWKGAAEQLKDADPQNIEGVEEHVYKSIKLSFDYLKEEEARVIRLCSLFPEDHNIHIEYLVWYGWGLRIFKDVDTVQMARQRSKIVINNLKEASLLLSGDFKWLTGRLKGFVKMHDVVRDVAISIWSDKYFVKAEHGWSLGNWPIKENTGDGYKGISLIGDDVGSYPVAWDFPNLEILVLRGNRIGALCSNYLSRLKELSVIHLTPRVEGGWFGDRMVLGPGHYAFSCRLRTLILRCIDGPDIAAIGKIITLEILDLQYCTFHEAPKATLSALINLRVLNLRFTCHDYVVNDKAVDGLSRLTRLEELYDESISWDELNKVRTLKVLLAIPPVLETVPNGFVFPEMESFYIFLHSSFNRQVDYHYEWDGCGRTLVLQEISQAAHYLIRENQLATLTSLLKHATTLKLDESHYVVSIFPYLTDNGDVLKLVNSLSVRRCDSFKYVADLENCQEMHSRLEILFLSSLPALEYIFKLSSTPRRDAVSFCNLRSVYVGGCPQLKYMFQPAIAQSLAQLETLEVWNCVKLEDIVSDDKGKEEEMNEGNVVVVFQNLKQVTLEYLPSLRGFCCKGNIYFEWPSLELLQVKGCPQMTTFTPATSGIQSTPKLKSTDFDGRLEITPQGWNLRSIYPKPRPVRETRMAAGFGDIINL